MKGLVSKLPNVGTTIFTVMSAMAKAHGAINLSQGFPDFDCDPELQDRVAFHLKNGKNQYVPMAGLPALRSVIATKVARLYDRRIDPDDEITIVAGATQGIFTVIQTFVRPNDEVIIFEPAYDCYKPAVELAGGLVKSYQLKHPDYRVDWQEVEQMISAQTKMIIINTPHNPIGKTLTSNDLEQLEQLVLKYNLLLLSDEVYEHLIYDGLRHESVLRYPKLYQHSMAVYSFGKTFHTTGWKIGYVVGPPKLMTEFRKVHQFNVFCVNSFVQYGIADYMKDPSTYESLPSFYQSKRDFFLEEMSESRFRPLDSKGSYFQLYDYSQVSELDDIEFSKKLITEHGVAVIPLSPFRSELSMDKVVRFCFAKKETTLRQAAERLTKIVKVD